MVIGEDFVWAHVPKAGGEATNAMFRLFPDLVIEIDEAHKPGQHRRFQDLGPDAETKDLVLNIRRLPSWILSWSLYVGSRKRGVDPFMSPFEMAASRRPDRVINNYTQHGEYAISHWLRMENLPNDFLAFVGTRREVTDEELSGVTGTERVNEMAYDRNLHHWFSSAHIELMYDRNPRWRELEEDLYGDTLIDLF